VQPACQHRRALILSEAKQGVRRRAPGPFAVELATGARDFFLKTLDSAFQFIKAEQFKILAHHLDQSGPAGAPRLDRLIQHGRLSLCSIRPILYLTHDAGETQAKSALNMMTSEMNAVEVEGAKGPAAALRLVSRPRPSPGPGEILIRVRAAGVNHADLLQRRGAYPPPPGASDILGMEAAGEVAELGPGAPRWRVGDRVTALMAGGGYAEYATVDARHALPIPEGLDFVQAASLPEAVFTVWSNVFEIGALKYGETLLAHGATSGIGITAIQLAKILGARVIATSRGEHKAARAKALGADLSIDSTTQDWTEAVRAFGGADVALDMVGGEQVGKDLSVMKPFGRVVMIAYLAGARGEIDFSAVLRRRLVLTGSTLRGRDADEKARLAVAVEAKVWPLLDSGAFKPVLAAVFPLAEAGRAHGLLERGDHVGKVVLAV